jgi:hypothetical protein
MTNNITKNKSREKTKITSPMTFEDWIRKHVSTKRLNEIERILASASLYPPQKLFNYNTNGIIAETVYRIHHDSFKGVSHSIFLATQSIELLLFLFFGEQDENIPLNDRFLPHLRSNQSNLYGYFVVIEKMARKLSKRQGGYFDIREDSLRIMGGAIFWYTSLLACIEVSKKALADDRWERSSPLTWDEAIVEYVTYQFSTEDELESGQWWPSPKSG